MYPDLQATLRLLRNEHTSVRLVGVFIEDVIYEHYGSARLSFPQIAEGVGVHEDTSYRAVKRLMRLGFVQRMKRGGRSNASVYCMSGR